MSTYRQRLLDIRARARAARVPMVQILREAGIPQRTYQNWLTGRHVPLVAPFERLVATAERLIAAKHRDRSEG